MSKTKTKILVAGLSLALVSSIGLAGCNSPSSQPASNDSSPESQNANEPFHTDLPLAPEVVSELDANLESTASKYKTVTVTATEIIDDNFDNAATYVIKFDSSKDKGSASSTLTKDGTTVKEYLDGDNEVIDYGSGKTYQMTLSEAQSAGATDLRSAEAFTDGFIGNFDKLSKHASGIDVQKDEMVENPTYALVFNAEELAEASELFGDADEIPVEMNVIYTFDASGRVIAISSHWKTASGSMCDRTILFTDYDSTEVDPAPQATKSYADYVSENATSSKQSNSTGGSSEAASPSEDNATRNSADNGN